MPRIDKLCDQIWRDPEFRMKWLIGGVLSTIPIVNLLVGGYCLRYVRQLRAGESPSLPAWVDWTELAVDGLRMVVLKLVFFGLPVLAGGLLTAFFAWVFNTFWLGFFGATIAFVPLCLGLAVGLPLWMAAVQRWVPSGNWARVLDLGAVARTAWRMAPAMVYPTLAFWGLCLLGWPFLGFSFFLGFGPYVAYSTAVYLGENRTQTGS